MNKTERDNRLVEIRKALQAYKAKNDLDETDLDAIDDLTAEARKLEAQDALEVEAAKAEAAAKSKQDALVKDAVAEARKKWESENRRPPFEVPFQLHYSDTAKYDNLSGAELALCIDVAKAFQRAGMDIAVSPGAYKALSLRVADMKDDNTEEGRKAVAYVKNAFKALTATNIDPTKEAVEAAIKAVTDPMYTGGSGIGSDWVGTAYSNELWRKIRADNNVVSKIPSMVIPDGYSNETIPLESTDLTWYKVAEVTAADGTMGTPAATITASQITTSSKNITVSKLGARGMYSGEMTEDELVRFAPQLRDQLEKSGSEYLESAVIDGDTETSATKNINDIAGTPASTDYFLVWDGFRKLALVTNTANSRSAAGALVVSDYKDTLKLLGTAGLAGSDPSQVSFIVDFNTHWKALELPEVKTRDVFGPATIENGFLTGIYGYKIVPSFQMHKMSNSSGYERKVNSAGKVDLDTATNDVYGAILAVRFDQWKFAYKRRMTIETTRVPRSDSWEIVGLMRCGLAYRDTEASAISYYVAV